MSLFAEEYEPIKADWSREMWLLDPGPFIDIAFEMGFVNFVFRSAYHEARATKQDFRKFIDMFARGRPWRAMWQPYPGNFTVLFTSMLGWDHPAAVWELWRANEMKLEQLQEMYLNPPPAGKYLGVYGPNSREFGDLAEVVSGQPHRVVLANAPARDTDWAAIATFAQRLQVTDPISTLHFHGQKSVGRTVGVAAKSFDHPVRLGWDDGFPRILLPNGLTWRTASKPTSYHKDWLRLIGVEPKEYLKITDRTDLSRETYRINLLSLRWAFLNWERAWDFRRQDADEADIESADLDWNPRSVPVRMRKTKSEIKELDRWLCNTCTLQLKCPYSREGSVCIVPDSEPAELASFFRTRSSFNIIEGLGIILAAQTKRAQHGIAMEEKRAEQIDDEGLPSTGLSPEVTRILNSVFDRGVQLAKLVDPALGARLTPKTQILNINAGMAPGIAPANAQALMSGVESALEARGIALGDATPDQIQEILAESAASAIDATSSEG